jgi:hypothetical protein
MPSSSPELRIEVRILPTPFPFRARARRSRASSPVLSCRRCRPRRPWCPLHYSSRLPNPLVMFAITLALS